MVKVYVKIISLFLGLILIQTGFTFAQSIKLKQLVSKTEQAKFDSIRYYHEAGIKLARAEKNIAAQTKLNYLYARQIYVNGNHDEAINIALKAIKQVEKLPPFEERVMLFYEASGIYSKNENLKVAENLINSGLSDAIKLDSTYLIADGNNRLGVIYEKRDLLDSAMLCYQKSLKLNLSVKNEIGTSYSYDNIAGIYGAKKQPEKALPYLKKSLAIRKKLNDQFAISIALINISETFNLLNQTDSAIAYAQQTVKIVKEIKFMDLHQYALNQLSSLFRKKGDFKTSLQYLEEGIVVKDSIFNSTKSKQIQELTTQYETEKKEEEIKNLNQKAVIKDLELEQKNIYLIITIIALLIGILIGYLIINRRKLKAKTALQKEIIKQQDIATKAVLDAEERERRRIATDLHDGVGQLLSAALMNLNGFISSFSTPKENEKVTLEKSLALVNESYDEMRSISHQMMPNALLKAGLATAIREFLSKIDENQIKINLNISGFNERLEDQVETVLYRVIQECVNNVIKHAKASTLSIQLFKDEEGISLAIEDNGLGFNQNMVTEGIGVSNIKSRVLFLNGTVEYDSKPNKGTLVNIFIPIN